MAEQKRGKIEPPDLSEKGGLKNGEAQRSDTRLFMQLLAFGGCADARSAVLLAVSRSRDVCSSHAFQSLRRNPLLRHFSSTLAPTPGTRLAPRTWGLIPFFRSSRPWRL